MSTQSSNTKTIPKDGLDGLKENWRVDAVAGFLVFLLALPLSLGIAKASQFPPAMGVLTAMIGGIFVAFFAGSRLTIKGPAAGLITVCAGAVAEMGGGTEGWHMACGVIIVTGVIQILFGFLKFGSLSDFFPHSAVHGMLAAIGIIILAKQIPVLLGVDPTMGGGKPLELYEKIPFFFNHANKDIALIGIISLIIMFGMPLIKNKWVKKIPAPMVVLLVTIPLGMYYGVGNIESVEKKHYALVSIGNFWGDVGFNANFSMIGTGVFWKYVFMFLFVNSLESLLTVKAIDGLDPFRRKSNYNKDLSALGAGNSISGFLGGLPMTSEVVRSSANINFGAKTRWANLFHGIFLLIAMLLMIPVIEMIPNAALGAMLIYAGYRLASPKEFIGTYKIGPEQFVIFMVTIGVTVAEDLLLGVAAGILTKIIFHLVNGASLGNLFKAKYEVHDTPEGYKIDVSGVATFSNFIGHKKAWDKLESGKKVVFDFSNAKLVDFSFMDQLHLFENDYKYNGGKVEVTGMEHLNPLSPHPLAARKAGKEFSQP